MSLWPDDLVPCGSSVGRTLLYVDGGCSENANPDLNHRRMVAVVTDASGTWVSPAILEECANVEGERRNSLPNCRVLPEMLSGDQVQFGLSAEEILKSYPTLTAAGIQAALAHAADLAQERVLPLPAVSRRNLATMDL